MTQLTKNPSFESINVGDKLPPFEIGETQETMDAPQLHTRIPEVTGMKPKEERNAVPPCGRQVRLSLIHI